MYILYVNKTHIVSTKTTMSTLSISISALIEAEIFSQKVALLKRVCFDNDLNFVELYAKYFDSPSPESIGSVTSEPVKATKTKAKSGGSTKCTGLTLKKTPCTFNALAGGCFCKRHLESSKKETKEKELKEPVKKASKSKKAKKPDLPMHTHELDGKTHAECDLCDSHGNPMEETTEFEMAKPTSISKCFDTESIKKPSADDEFYAEKEMGDQEEEDEAEEKFTCGGGIGEEEFEFEEEE